MQVFSHIFCHFRMSVSGKCLWLCCQLHYSTWIYALPRLTLYFSTAKTVYEPFPLKDCFFVPSCFWGVGLSYLYLSISFIRELKPDSGLPDTWHFSSRIWDQLLFKIWWHSHHFPPKQTWLRLVLCGESNVWESLNEWSGSGKCNLKAKWFCFQTQLHWGSLATHTFSLNVFCSNTRCHYSSFFGQIHI